MIKEHVAKKCRKKRIIEGSVNKNVIFVDLGGMFIVLINFLHIVTYGGSFSHT